MIRKSDKGNDKNNDNENCFWCIVRFKMDKKLNVFACIYVQDNVKSFGNELWNDWVDFLW